MTLKATYFILSLRFLVSYESYKLYHFQKWTGISRPIKQKKNYQNWLSRTRVISIFVFGTKRYNWRALHTYICYTQACRICRSFPAAHKKIWKISPTFRNLRVRISFYKKMYVKENNSVLFSIHEFFIQWIRQSCKRLVLFLFILFSRRGNPIVMITLLLLAVSIDWWLMARTETTQRIKRREKRESKK